MTTARAGVETGAGAPPQPDPLVVRPSRRRIRRDMAFSAAAVLLGVGAVLAGSRPDSPWRQIVVVVAVPTALAWQIRLWRRLLAADALLEVGSAGIRFNHLGHGWVTLPWSAVGKVTPDLLGSSVVVRLAPGVDPSTPGTVWPPEGLGQRWWRRRGFRPLLRYSDGETYQILAAVKRFRPARP